MSAKSIYLDLKKHKEGLIYDADGVVIAGKYHDEISAYRSKRHWIEVLSTYFLLEENRDYEIWVTSSLEDRYFVVGCCFVSACGRYAFWRLVNQQAPEAEAKLSEYFSNTQSRKRRERAKTNRDSIKLPMIIGEIENNIDQQREIRGLLKRILDLFS